MMDEKRTEMLRGMEVDKRKGRNPEEGKILEAQKSPEERKNPESLKNLKNPEEGTNPGNGEPEYPAGLKWTRQRKAIYDILLHATMPMSAAQIYREVMGQQTESYAMSTIYRVLGTFEEKGMVSKDVMPGEETAVFVLNQGGHVHYAVCLSCRKRIPLPECPFSHMRPGFGVKEQGFTVTGHKLEVYGYCKDCVGR